MRKLLIGSGLGVAVLAVAVFAMTNASAGVDALKVGSEMPDFTMKDLDGKEHKLSDLKGKIVVLDFVSKNCPWSKGHDSDMNALAKKYSEKGVVFLGINPNHNESVDAIAKYAEQASVPYPILKDEENAYANKVGATRTPEIYLVGKDGTLKYHGAFDNRKSPEQTGDTNYVAKALDSLLEGKPIETAQKNAWGCGIQRI